MPKQKDRVFHCQYDGCIYSHESKKHFKEYRYLKQHYDKVHAEKKFLCALCSKGFSTTTLLKSHENDCGKEFKCSCGVVYKSNEALLTHAKRKNHTLSSSPRSRKPPTDKLSNLPTLVRIQLVSGTPLIIFSPDSTPHSGNQQNTLACPTQFLALSKLVPTRSELTDKKEVSTQTESSINNPDLWLNFAQEEVNSDLKERINSLGTQTNAEDSPSVESPSSPWLGSSAETQTVDEDAVLKPFNLCNMHTQTPWNEMDHDQDSTELTHTETQTLLSSFLIDTLPECNSSNSNRKELLAKQSSEDAATDPMESLI